MTLKEFVSDTLLQIVEGVAAASQKNLRVAPRVVHHTGHDTPVVHTSAQNPRAFIVDFDVAITVSEKSGSGTKGDVAVYVLKAGGQSTSAAEHSTVSRVKFQVPVTYEHLA